MAVNEIPALIDIRDLGEDFYRDPHPFYAGLRERGPVHRIRIPSGQEAWLIVGYEQGRGALADPRLSKEWANASAALGLRSTASGRHMLYSDPPYHTRLRKLVSRVFTQNRIDRLAPAVQRTTDMLLDAIFESRTDLVDLVESFCVPLPILVICDLLGVPELDRTSFREWADNAGSTNKTRREAATAAAAEYIPSLIEAKRRDPGDDLISALIKAGDEDGERLSGDELQGMIWLLLVAGYETTVNFLSNGLVALLRHPGQLAALRSDQTLIGNAVEEMLRYDGPIETPTYRFTVDPVDIKGTTIPGGGELVLIAVSDANRDPSRFPEPDTFDIHRDIRGHVAFGHGIHYCLGAPLARLEGRIAVNTLLARCPRLELDGDPASLSWRGGIMIRGPRALPVRFR